jgi:hypothetical protein
MKEETKILLLLGVALIVAKFSNRIPSAGSDTVSAVVESIAKAIARAEGYGVPGAIPTVRNNPGNIKSGGAIATFSTPEEGWNALFRQVRLMFGGSSFYGPDMPISDIARTYTGEAAYMNWARNVSAFLSMPLDGSWTLRQYAERYS